ncbi:MAG: hypothetical protein HYV09_40535 [Deltaproteobacteria bacterium]|nr:hypothetical protein [Deltaproteobacteria bacterium]
MTNRVVPIAAARHASHHGSHIRRAPVVEQPTVKLDAVTRATVDRARLVALVLTGVADDLEAGREPRFDVGTDQARRLWLVLHGKRKQVMRARIDVVQAVRLAAEHMNGTPAERADAVGLLVGALHPELAGRVESALLEAAIVAWQRKYDRWRTLYDVFVAAQLDPPDKLDALRREFNKWESAKRRPKAAPRAPEKPAPQSSRAVGQSRS